MKKIITQAVFLVLILGVFSSVASAVPTGPLGTISWDVDQFNPNLGRFDIVNQTGANSTAFPDPTWPVSTGVTFTLANLQLVVTFTDASTQTYSAGAYFTAAPSGSWNGNNIAWGGGNPTPTGAILTGTVNEPGLTMNDGSVWTLSGALIPTVIPFSAGGLADLDFGVIYAEGDPVGGVPEPSSLLLLGVGLVSLAGLRRTQRAN